MKIIIADTYHPDFLKSLYRKSADLAQADYQRQLRYLMDSCFGTSDFYSRHLNDLGYDARDLVVNCAPLQQIWAKANGVPFSKLALNIPHRLFQLPMLGKFLMNFPGLMEVAINQIKALKPDILYCQDLSFFPSDVLCELKKNVRLIVGQIACPLPSENFLRGYDLILTSFPHYVQRLRLLGINSEYFKIGFDERVLSLLGDVKKETNFTFVGGISRHHSDAISLLEYLAEHTDIRIYGYGAETLKKTSPLRIRHNGEVWGLDMYRALAQSQVTLNRHINVAENYANNMRLFEATGVGTMLLTDRKDNLSELFAIGKELVVYSSKEEAAELVCYYRQNPEEAEKIAKAGQARTLSEHTYSHRMQELVTLLKRYLR